MHAHRIKMASQLFLVLTTLSSCSTVNRDPNAALQPKHAPYPKTRAEAVTDTLFGESVRDPYRWLEDEKAPEVQTWMKTQDQFARAHLAGLPGRSHFASRLKEIFYFDATRTPFKRGNRYFYAKKLAREEKAIIYWREGKSGKERVLLNPNTMSTDGSVSIGTWVPSWDGKRVVYAVRPNNADEAVLHVRDVATGKESSIDVIEGAKYAEPQWTPQGDAFYYTYLPTDPSIRVADRPGQAEVRFHRLGTDPKTDALIYPHTGNPETFIGPQLSRDGRWLFVGIEHGWNRSEVYFKDLNKDGGKAAFQPLFVGPMATAQVLAWKNRFFVLTNDEASRYRVIEIDPAHPERAHWKTIVPEREGVVIENAQIIGGHLVLSLLERASNQLEVWTLNGKRTRAQALPGSGGIGSLWGVSGNPDEDEAYFGFASFLLPPQVYRFSVQNGRSSLWAAVKLAIDPSPYEIEQVEYDSKDGTPVSMFIVKRKGLPRDGSTPLLLSGYGGFNVSLKPDFSASIYPWLEMGGAYAVANIRGGGEYGEAWHQAGMLTNKQNVFDDFIAAGEYLIHEGYTRRELLAIRGGSNGGLLMGAMMTQRPDLFRAVVCAVPLLDMVRYHHFGSGRTWVPEYGSAENEEQFRALYEYSPYHRVESGTSYPSVLFLSSDHDDRVDPMHARKMAAQIQAADPDGRPILLRIEKNAGHGGADMISKTIEQAADMYAFLMNELDIQ